MKKVGLLLLLSLVGLPNIFAQDILVLNSKERIEAKVVEIGINEVKYRKFSNLEGPLYSISKSDIFLIMYENGSQESFETSKNALKTTRPASSNTSSSQSLEQMMVPTNTYRLNSSDKAKLRENDIGIYNEYNNARTAKTVIGVIGGVSSLVVIGSVVVNLANFDKNDTSSSNFAFGPVFYVAAGVSLVSGLIGKGPKRRIKESLMSHNQSVRNKINSQASLNFGVSNSGNIGLVMNF